VIPLAARTCSSAQCGHRRVPPESALRQHHRSACLGCSVRSNNNISLLGWAWRAAARPISLRIPLALAVLAGGELIALAQQPSTSSTSRTTAGILAGTSGASLGLLIFWICARGRSERLLSYLLRQNGSWWPIPRRHIRVRFRPFYLGSYMQSGALGPCWWRCLLSRRLWLPDSGVVSRGDWPVRRCPCRGSVITGFRWVLSMTVAPRPTCGCFHRSSLACAGLLPGCGLTTCCDLVLERSCCRSPSVNLPWSPLIEAGLSCLLRRLRQAFSFIMVSRSNFLQNSLKTPFRRRAQYSFRLPGRPSPLSPSDFSAMFGFLQKVGDLSPKRC